jgi:hypothetical protein
MRQGGTCGELGGVVGRHGRQSTSKPREPIRQRSSTQGRAVPLALPSQSPPAWSEESPALLARKDPSRSPIFREAYRDACTLMPRSVGGSRIPTEYGKRVASMASMVSVVCVLS